MIENRFIQSDIGLIPEDWSVVVMDEVASVARGGSPRPIEAYLTDSPDGVNWIKIGDVGINAKFIEKTEERIIPDGAQFSRRVFPGDFLLSNSMSFGRPYILKISGCIHDGWLVIQQYQSTFDTDYLYYALSSSYMQGQYRALAAGSSVLNLNKNIVKKVLIKKPLIDEQKRIAKALSDIDSLLVSIERELSKVKNIRSGLVRELLTGKKRLPQYTKPWLQKNLGKSANIKARIGWQGLTTSEYLDFGDYYLITGTDFLDGGIAWKGCHFVSKERFDQDPYIKIQEQDVLVTKDGTIGKVAYLDKIPGPGTLNSGVFVIRTKDEDISQRYLAKVFISKYFDDFIESIVAGSTIIHLYQKDIVKFDFSVPPTIEEQNAICDVIEDMDKEIRSLTKKLDKYTMLKDGMMQQLLTGKIRLV